MKTVQLALHDVEYAQSLRTLLLRDGSHRVVMVDHPDLKLDGVVVVDGGVDNLSMLEFEPERFVVLTRKGTDNLSKVWEAGVRHVVFEGDSPNTAQLAIIAAELRLPRAGAISSGRTSASHHERRHYSRNRPIFNTRSLNRCSFLNPRGFQEC